MTNTTLLKEKIKKSGLKMEFIAEKVGITRQSLYMKVNGKNLFNQNEINILCDLLQINTLKEKDCIFFCQ